MFSVINKKREMIIKSGAIAIALSAAFFTGCRQSNEAVPAVAQDQARVIALVNKDGRPGTLEAAQANFSEYKTLSFDELELFNKMKLERQFEEVKKMYNAGGQVSQGDMALLNAQAKAVSELRSHVNKLSLERYGRPYNQVELAQIDQLLEEATAGTQYAVLATRPAELPAAGRVDRTNACTAINFPNVAYRVSEATQNWSSWTQRANPSTPADCDYEYLYPGTRYNFRPYDIATVGLSEMFSNQLSRRWSGGNTYLLIGATRLYLSIGFPNLLFMAMR